MNGGRSGRPHRGAREEPDRAPRRLRAGAGIDRGVPLAERRAGGTPDRFADHRHRPPTPTQHPERRGGGRPFRGGGGRDDVRGRRWGRAGSGCGVPAAVSGRAPEEDLCLPGAHRASGPDRKSGAGSRCHADRSPGRPDGHRSSRAADRRAAGGHRPVAAPVRAGPGGPGQVVREPADSWVGMFWTAGKGYGGWLVAISRMSPSEHPLADR